MEAINAYLERFELGEDAREPLIRLKEICASDKFSLSDDEASIILRSACEMRIDVRDEDQTIEYDGITILSDEAEKSLFQALLAVMSDEELTLTTSQKRKVNISWMREDLKNIFTKRIKEDSIFMILWYEAYLRTCQERGEPPIEYLEFEKSHVITREELSTGLAMLKNGAAKGQAAIGDYICTLMGLPDLWSIIESCGNVTRQSLLIGEILRAAGVLAKYSEQGIWDIYGDGDRHRMIKACRKAHSELQLKRSKVKGGI